MRRLSLLVWASLCACAPQRHEVSSSTDDRDLRDEVIYQIVVDRFDNADPNNDAVDGIEVVPGDLARHQGGDFAGILRRLDYLEHLGATTLWLGPIVDNVARTESADGYHGYWARDFTEINRHFGSEDELRALVREAHARGMRVLLDVVINHAGNVFFYDVDGDGLASMFENEPVFADPSYSAQIVFTEAPVRMLREGAAGLEIFDLDRTFFHLHGQTTNWSNPDQIELGDFPTGLRDLATDRDEVMEALITTQVEWVRRTDVDGFRLDAVPHVSHADWARFCRGMRERLASFGKRQFFLLGEVFRTEPQDLASYTRADEMDSVFDFTFKFDAIDGFVLEGAPASLAREALESARAAYPSEPQELGVGLTPWQARVLFADNHDVPRIRSRLDDARAVWLAMTLMYTTDGVPALYYGTEQDLTGSDGHETRAPLWTTGFDEQNTTFKVLAQLAKLRRDHLALRRGDLIVRFASEHDGRSDEADAGVLAFERVSAQERVLVVINAHATQKSRASFDTGFASGAKLRDLLGSKQRAQVGADGRLDIELAPRSAVVLSP